MQITIILFPACFVGKLVAANEVLKKKQFKVLESSKESVRRKAPR